MAASVMSCLLSLGLTGKVRRNLKMDEKVDKGKDEVIQDQREDDSLSRRDFIKRGAVVGAGAAAIGGVSKAAVAASSSADDIVWDYEVDVLVVGAGCAGLPAAIKARDLGASVMLVDQNFDVGGKMLHSGSWTSLGGGDALQKRDLAGASDAVSYTHLTLPTKA